MITIPRISKDLVRYLEETIPLRNPEPSTPERQLWINVGKRQVVDLLVQLHDEQERGLLQGGSTANVLLQSAADGGSSEDRDARRSSSTAARTPGAPGNRLGS